MWKAVNKLQLTRRAFERAAKTSNMKTSHLCLIALMFHVDFTHENTFLTCSPVVPHTGLGGDPSCKCQNRSDLEHKSSVVVVGNGFSSCPQV